MPQRDDVALRIPRMRMVGLLLMSAAVVSAATLDDATRQLSHGVFKELIEINTTDSTGSTTSAANAMARRLREAGIPASDIQVLGPNDRKGNLVARLRGTGAKKPILIIGHLDVVEAKREDWTTDPFTFVEKDGYFYGRGTQDMKANDAILVTTFIRFQREQYRPVRDVILALTADEEGGQWNGVEWLLKNHRNLVDAEFVLNADSGGVTTAQGKLVNVDVEASEKQYAGACGRDFTSPGQLLGSTSKPKRRSARWRRSTSRQPVSTQSRPNTRSGPMLRRRSSASSPR